MIKRFYASVKDIYWHALWLWELRHQHNRLKYHDCDHEKDS